MPITAQAAKETFDYINSHDAIEVRAVLCRGSDMAGYADALKVCAGEAGVSSFKATERLLGLPGLDKKSAPFQSAITSVLEMLAGKKDQLDTQIVNALIKEAQPESLTRALSGLFRAAAERQVVKSDYAALKDSERLAVAFIKAGGSVHTAHTEAQGLLEKEKDNLIEKRGDVLNTPLWQEEDASSVHASQQDLADKIKLVTRKQSEMLNLFGRLRNIKAP